MGNTNKPDPDIDDQMHMHKWELADRISYGAYAITYARVCHGCLQFEEVTFNRIGQSPATVASPRTGGYSSVSYSPSPTASLASSGSGLSKKYYYATSSSTTSVGDLLSIGIVPATGGITKAVNTQPEDTQNTKM